jgi:glycosyltransferase involved in cell wall biosynthesis
MHLVYLIDSLVGGGAQRQAVELATRLVAEPGVRVTFLVYRPEDFHASRLEEAGIPVVRPRRSGRFDLMLPIRMGRWMRSERPDLVHAYLRMPSLWGFLAVRSAPARVRPVFVAAERNELVGDGGLLDRVTGFVYRHADAVTANAERAAHQIEERFAVPAERIHYLPNGIDLGRWDRQACAEAPLELEPGLVHLALIGQLRRQKNHVAVLDALEALGPDRTRGWRVWFVGDEAGEPDYGPWVRSEIERRGLGPLVRVVPAVRNVAALMRHLDALLLPSLHEGFPNVVMEAMASRLPVIVSRVGDVPNMVADGCEGLLLERPDGASMARALEAFAGLDEAQRRAMGEQGRRRVGSSYAMGAIAGRHLALYRSLVARRQRGPG